MTKVIGEKMLDLEVLSKEHEALFPKADLASQVYKLDEEILESQKAETAEQKLREIADCIICCIGIYRFAPNVAKQFMDKVSLNSEQISDVEFEVLRKWNVNKSRKWEWNGKTYKHVGKDGNE